MLLTQHRFGQPLPMMHQVPPSRLSVAPQEDHYSHGHPYSIGQSNQLDNASGVTAMQVVRQDSNPPQDLAAKSAGMLAYSTDATKVRVVIIAVQLGRLQNVNGKVVLNFADY